MTTSVTPRLLRTAQLARELGICRTTLYRWVRDGGFPHPRQIGPGIKGWLPAEVDEWLKSRVQLSQVDDRVAAAAGQL